MSFILAPLVPVLRRGSRLLLDTLFPPLCPGCGVELTARRWLCGSCRRRLRRAPAGPFCPVCRVRDRPGGDREAGFDCRDPAHEAFTAYSAFWMEPPLDAVIHAFKYGGRRDLARALGRVTSVVRPPAGEATVVGVPPHRTRRRERGYDQAGLLARAVAVRWGFLPGPAVLERQRATRPQARLSEAERAANLAGAFRLREPGWARSRSWILVDDVATTGSTLLEAGQTLLAGGARRVIGVTLAVA